MTQLTNIKEKLNRFYIKQCFDKITVEEIAKDLEQIAAADPDFLSDYLLKIGFVSSFQPQSPFSKTILSAVKKNPTLVAIAKKTKLSFWLSIEP